MCINRHWKGCIKIKNKNKFEKYVLHDDYAEFFIYDNTDKVIKNVLVSLEDVDILVRASQMSFYGKKRLYLKVDKNILHRTILEYSGSLFVDHIDGNTFNNRRENLRIVTQSTNQRNLHNFYRNNTGIIGIQYRTNGNYKYFRVSWRELSGNRKTKQFNINKYGECVAFEMAKNFLREKYLENDYLIKF